MLITKEAIASVCCALVLLAGCSSDVATAFGDGGHADHGPMDAASADAGAPDDPDRIGLASPFGVHPASANSYEYARDLGLRWNREGAYFLWVWADKGRDGRLSFKNATAPAKVEGRPPLSLNYDEERLQLNEGNLHMMANVCPFVRGGSFADEAEKQHYSRFVRAMVERYDGDDDYGCSEAAPDCFSPGDSEHPSEQLVASFREHPTKYWQVCNQLTDTCEGEGCSRDGYAAHYAQTQRLTYEAVKEADPTAQVLIAGDSAPEMYPAVYQALGGRYVDIIDIHTFRTEERYDPAETLASLKGALTSAGFDVAALPFWITEAGTYSGDPVMDRDPPSDGPPFQSERQQASGLLKMYVSSFAAGVEKVFWAWGIVEGFGCNCCFFDHTGLVYDGNEPPNPDNCEQNDPYDRGRGVKKLAYYAYKKMVEMLEGSDWENVETIHDADGVRVYKFFNTQTRKAVWVAWNDDQPKSVTLDLETGGVVAEIIEAIPKSETGQQVTSYAGAFEQETRDSPDGRLSLELGELPVFVTTN